MDYMSITTQAGLRHSIVIADNSQRHEAPAQTSAAERPIGENSDMQPDAATTIGRDSDKMIWYDPSTWMPQDPIDTKNAKYSIRPGMLPVTTIYSNDGITWYRQRTILNPRSWFYDPYNIDHRSSVAIKDAIRIQDEAREQGITPRPVYIYFYQPKAAAASSTEKADDIDCMTIAPKLAPEEEPSGIWGYVGRKPLNRNEISKLPAIAPARAIYGGYADLITWGHFKTLCKSLISQSSD